MKWVVMLLHASHSMFVVLAAAVFSNLIFVSVLISPAACHAIRPAVADTLENVTVLATAAVVVSILPPARQIIVELFVGLLVKVFVPFALISALACHCVFPVPVCVKVKVLAVPAPSLSAMIEPPASHKMVPELVPFDQASDLPLGTLTEMFPPARQSKCPASVVLQLSDSILGMVIFPPASHHMLAAALDVQFAFIPLVEEMSPLACQPMCPPAVPVVQLASLPAPKAMLPLPACQYAFPDPPAVHGNFDPEARLMPVPATHFISPLTLPQVKTAAPFVTLMFRNACHCAL